MEGRAHRSNDGVLDCTVRHVADYSVGEGEDSSNRYEWLNNECGHLQFGEICEHCLRDTGGATSVCLISTDKQPQNPAVSPVHDGDHVVIVHSGEDLESGESLETVRLEDGVILETVRLDSGVTSETLELENGVDQEIVRFECGVGLEGVSLVDGEDPEIDSSQQICCECGKVYKNERSLNDHRRKVHKEEIQCKLCPRKFKNPSNLSRHIQTIHVHSRSEYQCEKCGKIFGRLDNFKRHMNMYKSVGNGKSAAKPGHGC